MPRFGQVAWLSGRSIGLHAVMLVSVSLCAIAAEWQVERALAGNTLSWLYVFEWPAFAVIGIFLWWELLSRASAPSNVGGGDIRRPSPGHRLPTRGGELRWDESVESARLQAYNAYLADLHAGRPAKRPR